MKTLSFIYRTPLIFTILLMSVLLPDRLQAQYIPVDSGFAELLRGDVWTCVVNYQLDTNCAKNIQIPTNSGIEANPLIGHPAGYRCRSLEGLQYVGKNLEGSAVGTRSLSISGIDSLRYIPALPSIYNSVNISNAPMLDTIGYWGDSVSSIVIFRSNINAWPPCPLSLKSISIINCDSLTTLPAFNNGLEIFRCGNSPIVSLPALPASLKELYCAQLPITSLPAFGNSLTSLRIEFCSNLTSLPALPSSLSGIEVTSNSSLTSLLALPATLKRLFISNNGLTHLPELPDSLSYMSCVGNQLTALPELQHTQLTQLFCSNNPITCMPVLPNTLTALSTSNTLVACLPNYPPGLNTTMPYCNSNSACEYPGLKGRVYVDRNNNCVFDSNDMPLRNRMLKLNDSNYTLTDINGYYRLIADTQDHEVQLFNTVNPYGYACGDSVIQITLTGHETIDTLDFPLTITSYCTNLTIDIAAPFIRNTTLNYHQVYIINTGTDTAYNSYTEIQFDPELIPLDCSFPYTVLADNTIRVTLGDIAPFQEIQFTITDSVSIAAPLGQAACVRAKVYPAGNCTPVSAQWDSSHISIQSIWLPGEPLITFKAKNTGKPMSDSTEYRIYEEELLMLKGRFKLAELDSFTVTVPANGHTYRMEADQRPFHPGFSRPRDFMELAGTPPYILHHIVTVPQDDDDEWVEIDCHEIVASYDPNHKTVSPAGVGINHYVTNEDMLEYILQFQNTGNDTAFNIRLIDTLNTALLDATTFKSGVSSHPYVVSMRGNGIVEWRFANIKLVDSTTNEPGSHGFVKFKIKQLAGNLPGTVINNFVDIYFDYNEPVRTNTAFVTIEEKDKIFLSVATITPIAGYTIYVMPNPFAQTANFEIATENTNHHGYTFELFDMLGRRVISKQVGNRFTLNRGDIDAGVYMYRLTSNGMPVGSGKIVAR